MACGGLAWRMSTPFFLGSNKRLCVALEQVAEVFYLLPTHPSGDNSHLCHVYPCLLREAEPT